MTDSVVIVTGASQGGTDGVPGVARCPLDDRVDASHGRGRS
jgi:hypothetical protein